MKLRRTIRLLCLLAGIICAQSHLKAQQNQISGTVKNEKGEPIEAASVQVIGTGNGTLSDKNGAFKLNASASDSLVISYVGYDSLHVSANSNLQITLHNGAGNLNEVVVIG